MYIKTHSISMIKLSISFVSMPFPRTDTRVGYNFCDPPAFWKPISASVTNAKRYHGRHKSQRG